MLSTKEEIRFQINFHKIYDYTKVKDTEDDLLFLG